MKHIASRLVTSVVTLLSFIVVLTTAFVSCEESTPVELTPSVTPGSGGGNSGGGQEEEKPYLTVSPQSLSFDADDNSLETIKVSSNTTYRVSTNASWIKLTPSGNDNYVVSVSANEEETMREDSVIVSSATLRQSVKVQQLGKAVEYTLSIDKTMISAGSSAHSDSLHIIGNDIWTATPSDEWITLSATSGIGEQQLYVSLTANEQPSVRTGNVMIIGEKSGAELLVNVSQSGTDYNFAVSLNSITATSAATTQGLDLTTNDAWRAQCEATWVSLSATEGSGDSHIEVSLSENQTTEERKATLTLTGKNSGSSASILVKQAGKYLTVDPETLSFEAAGGTEHVTVDTDGTFSTSKSDSWLTVSTSGHDLSITTSANASTSSRSGTVTVSLTGLTSGSNSRVISITQTGEDYDLSVDKTSLSFDSNSGSKTFTITSNDSWTASSNVTWATLSSTSGSGNKTITVSCTANTNTTERSGTITIQGSYSGSKSISVSQEGKSSSGGGNGYDNGHEYVDLGLPSGLLWATCNVGANSPEEYGDYFAWGETEPKSYYDWSTYFDTNDGGSTFQKYNNNGGKTVLEPADDAAHINWGGSWRMPTYEELDELKTKCTWEWTTQNGVKGRKVTGPNGNSIFLPAAGVRINSSLGYAGSSGYYWSSSLYAGYSDSACLLYFGSGNVDWGSYDRYDGRSVRPVR